MGDPHCMGFDLVKFDFMKRGEFKMYGDADSGIEIQLRFGRPFFGPWQGMDHLSTNHAVAFSGQWTCGMVFEYFAMWGEDKQPHMRVRNVVSNKILMDVSGIDEIAKEIGTHADGC